MVEVIIEGKGSALKKITHTQLELYSSIKEMPIDRYQEFNKLACIDMGIGSTLEDFNKHFTSLHAYLANNKIGEAIQETKNIHNNFFYMVEKIGIWSYCFCAFIKSINGKAYEKVELDEHRETINILSKKGLKTGQCQSVLDEIKKKLNQNLNSTFLIDSIAQAQLTHYLN